MAEVRDRDDSTGGIVNRHGDSMIKAVVLWAGASLSHVLCPALLGGLSLVDLAYILLHKKTKREKPTHDLL